MRRTVLLPLVAVMALPWAVAADKPRLRFERIDPSQLAEGKLRAFASVVELEGTLIEGLGAGSFTLFIDGRNAGHGLSLQRYAATNEEVYVAFVVEVAAQYKKALEPVKAALVEFLEDQPRQLKGMLIAYGDEVEVRSALVPAAALADPIEALTCDENSADVQMVNAVREAMKELNRIPPRPDGSLARRLVVLISDGLNFKMDRQTFKQLGVDARKAGLPIHTLAFSPGDERGPLLNLGELSKRSIGTFRWAARQDDLKPQLDNLAEEVRRQYVLTFGSTLAKATGHVFQLREGALVSNKLSGTRFEVAEAHRAGVVERLGRWIYLLIALAALLALYLLGLVLQARGVVPQPGAARPPRARPSEARAAPARAAPPAAAPAPAALVAATRATLVVIGGPRAGQRFEVRAGQPLTIGKAAGNAVIISDDGTVSSRHAEVGRDGAGFYCKDLGSTNGSFANDARIGGLHRLADGDIIRLGAGTQFKVRID